MVERQGRVDGFALLDAEELGEPDAAHGEPQMPDDRRLGVAGGARRVDVEEHVVAANLGDVGRRSGGGPEVVQRDCAARERRARGRVRQEADRVGAVDRGQRGERRRVADSDAGSRGSQHVGKSRAGHVRVDERADASQLGHRAQREQKERGVRGQDGARIARAQAGAA